jgi:Leucine-rich repeat (LRR) protein
MNNLVRNNLKIIVNNYGINICDDSKKCEALLRDLCPQYKREINLLISVLRENIVSDLLKLSNKDSIDIILVKLIQRLYDNLGIAPEFAAWAVESWALILEIISSPNNSIRNISLTDNALIADLEWWRQLDSEWKTIFMNAIHIQYQPNEQELYQIINLTELDCRYHPLVSNFKPLKFLKNLIKLDCSLTSSNDLHGLAHLQNLQSLSCWGNEIKDLEALSNLQQLESLYCAENQITDLTPLENLSNLKSLSCWNNPIISLEPLLQLENLEYLNCKDTQISQLQIKTFKSLMPKCEVIHNFGYL